MLCLVLVLVVAVDVDMDVVLDQRWVVTVPYCSWGCAYLASPSYLLPLNS